MSIDRKHQTPPARVPAASFVPSIQGLSQTLGKRDTVFRDGEAADRIFEVNSGVLMVYALLPDGRRQVVEIVPKGWLCGFAKQAHYNGTCVALTDATVTAYQRADLEAGDHLRQNLLLQAERQYCSLHDLALTLGQKSAPEKLATFLMRFVPGRGQPGCDGPKKPADDAFLRIPMSRADIGDFLGLTLETVSRELAVMAQQGLIVLGPGRGEVKVNNICRLCDLARMGQHEKPARSNPA